MGLIVDLLLGGWLALLTGLGVGFEACGIEAPAPPTSIAAIYPISDLNDPYVPCVVRICIIR